VTPTDFSQAVSGPAYGRFFRALASTMVRTVNGRFRFFFGGWPELPAAFARIAQACRT